MENNGWKIDAGSDWPGSWWEYHEHRDPLFPFNISLEKNSDKCKTLAKEGKFSLYKQQNEINACSYRLVGWKKENGDMSQVDSLFALTCQYYGIPLGKFERTNKNIYVGFDSLMDALDFILTLKQYRFV